MLYNLYNFSMFDTHKMEIHIIAIIFMKKEHRKIFSQHYQEIDKLINK